MSTPSFNTVNLIGWLDRLRAGDLTARDELLRAGEERLRQLTAKMFRKYRTVIRWADVEDVLSGAAMRLLRALESTPVTDTRQFFSLAATVIRRELIDLARHFGGPQGIGANHASTPPRDDGSPGIDPPAEADPAELELWAALHEAAEQLPAEEREVFGLTFYHRWSQQQIAELFQVDERTVRRRLKKAFELLRAALGAELPGL